MKIKKGIKCLECNTEMYSLHRHDFVKCICPNQAFVDGGGDYVRCGAMDITKIEAVEIVLPDKEE